MCEGGLLSAVSPPLSRRILAHIRASPRSLHSGHCSVRAPPPGPTPPDEPAGLYRDMFRCAMARALLPWGVFRKPLSQVSSGDRPGTGGGGGGGGRTAVRSSLSVCGHLGGRSLLLRRESTLLIPVAMATTSTKQQPARVVTRLQKGFFLSATSSSSSSSSSSHHLLSCSSQRSPDIEGRDGTDRFTWGSVHVGLRPRVSREPRQLLSGLWTGRNISCRSRSLRFTPASDHVTQTRVEGVRFHT